MFIVLLNITMWDVFNLRYFLELRNTNKSFVVLKLRAGNSLMGFLCELLVFCEKNDQMSDFLKKTSDSLIRSFLVSHLSHSLTSLIFGEWPEWFAHIALTKNEGMSESLNFFKQKTYIKHTKK